jgi:S-adenosylmethionine-dependent methyltransferase
MSTTAKFDSERFQSDAQKYAAYLETPEGRLRIELPLASLQEFLPLPKHDLHALDVGGGTGAIAVRLARLGFHVTLLDSSQAMLDLAKRAAQDADIVEKIALKHGDAQELADPFDARSFDVIVCHNVLEFVGNPVVVLQECARLMRDSSAIISVLVRSQAGEVLKAALQAGDLAAAEKNLNCEWAEESLYGGAVRLFTQDVLHTMLKSASLQAIAVRGVRVVSDYLPSKLSRNAEYDRIFELESKLGRRPEFAAVARYIHCLARCVSSDGG